jgi:opacity protein-like surface antigen
MKRIAQLACIAAALVFAAALVVAAEEAAKPAEPFNGKDFTGWKFRAGEAKSQWKVGKAQLDEKNPTELLALPDGSDLVNTKPHSTDIITEGNFGDVVITCEVMMAKGSNSGIYLMGRYELQLLDSFGKEKDFGPGDMGGIYNTAAPKNPKYVKPGDWNTLQIEFYAPKFDAQGKKVTNARFAKVVLNGATIHDNVQAPKPTGGELGQEAAVGPLMFQGDHGPVAIRNLKISPLK